MGLRSLAISKINQVRSQLDLTLSLLIASTTIMLVSFLIIPLAGVLQVAFTFGGKPSLIWFERISSSNYYINLMPTGEFATVTSGGKVLYITGFDMGVILNSLIVASLVTIIGIVLALPISFVLGRYDFPGKTIFRALAMVPLIVTPFVNAFIVKKLFSLNGPINWILYEKLGLIPWRILIDGLAGVIITQAITFYPIIVLNLYASFVNIDPSLEEQAENLGAKGFRLFRKVTLPLALPGLTAGATLTFIFSLEDLGAPIVFHGHPLAKKLMSFQVFSAFIGEVGERPPEIAALAVILLSIALTGFVAVRKYVSMRTYAMVGRGSGKVRIRRLGRKGLMVTYLVVLPILVFTALPQFFVVLLAFSERWTGVFPKGLTLSNISQVFLNPDVRNYVVNSISYASLATVIALMIGLAAAYVTSRLRFAGSSLLDTLSMAPLAIPGIVIAVAYFYFFSEFFRGTFLDPTSPLAFDPALIIIVALAVRRLPFSARSIYAGLQQVHVALEEASMNLGAGRGRTIAKIIVPLLIINMVSGALITFIYATSEVSVSITIGSLRPERGPITVYMKDIMLSAVASETLAAALGLLLIMIQLSAILTVTLGLKQRYAFIGV